MRRLGPTAIKFGVFAAVMALLTAALFAIFGQYRAGSANAYSAVFAPSSGCACAMCTR